MAKCRCCKNKIEKKQPCPNCGELLGTFDGNVLCAPDKGAQVNCQVTNKYFIFYAVNALNIWEIISWAIWINFGIIAGLIYDLFINLGVVNRRYGYVDMNDIRMIIVEQVEGKKKFTKTFGFKIVLNDGKEIVISGIGQKSYDTALEILNKTGIKIVMGTKEGMVCTNPYTAKSYQIRDCVCASAAGFVKLHKKHKVMPPVENPYTGITE